MVAKYMYAIVAHMQFVSGIRYITYIHQSLVKQYDVGVSLHVCMCVCMYSTI